MNQAHTYTHSTDTINIHSVDKLIPFPKIRVARKTCASTTPSRVSKFDKVNRTFWVWY